MPTHLRPSNRRARRAPGIRAGTSPGRAASRRSVVAVWRRQWLARLPVGPILLIGAAAISVATLRLAPADLGVDPAQVEPVVVARALLDAGSVIDADDVELRSLPVGVVSDGFVGDRQIVVGRQVTATIFMGEPVLAGRLAPEGLVGIAAATPPGRSAFAVPVDPTLPPTAVGQHVDLYALDPLTRAGGISEAVGPTDRAGAARIARSALVVGVDDQRITVAVEPSEAPGVAAALIGSTVVVAVAGPDAQGGP